jgi:hypothetical protein
MKTCHSIKPKKDNMIKHQLVLLALVSVFRAEAQTVTPVLVSSHGGFATAAGGSIAWSIGEPLSETRQTGTNIITQGFHQPDLNVATLIAEQGSGAEVLVFPNPVQESLAVSLQGLPEGTYRLRLTDALGKLIDEREVTPSMERQSLELNVARLASASYYLVVDSEQLHKTIKIVKTN